MLTLIFGMSELVSLIFDMVYLIGISYNTKKEYYSTLVASNSCVSGTQTRLFCVAVCKVAKVAGQVQRQPQTEFSNKIFQFKISHFLG